MNKYVNISKDIVQNRPSKLTTKLDSEYVYLPIDSTTKVLFNPGKILKKETIIAMNNNIPIVTPISGEFMGIEEVKNYEDKPIKALVIKNNYKEETGRKIPSKRNLNKYTKEVILLILQRLNIKTNDNKFLYKEIDREPKKLYINAICDEPNNYNIEFRLLNNKDIILETISALNMIFNITNSEILIKDTSSLVISNYYEYLGSYPNIKLCLVKDIYPISKYEVLKNYLHLDSKELVINLEDLYKLGYALKRQRFTTEKLLTISGPVVEDPHIYEIKIGTKLSEVLDIKNIKEKYDIWINNYLEQNKMLSDDVIIDDNIDAIIITLKEGRKVSACTRCGICYNSCPIGLNPRKLDDKEIAKKCLHCGLCSYMCPANILLHKKGVKVNE